MYLIKKQKKELNVIFRNIFWRHMMRLENFIWKQNGVSDHWSLTLSKRGLNKKYRDTPVEPWAFIRVKNEIETISQCLKSILPVIKKGVIGYHKLSDGEMDDGTETVLEEFCKNNPGYILYKYEFEVIPSSDKRYQNLDDVKVENRLDNFYNAVLTKIPMGEWLIKIDGDHIYDTEKLKKLMYLPESEKDVIVFPLFNLHYADNKLYVLKNSIIKNNGDHWLLMKTKNTTFSFKSGQKDNRFYAWETLNIRSQKGARVYHTDLFNWHFPYLKKSRDVPLRRLIDFKQFRFSILDKIKYGITKDMYDHDRIQNLLNK